MSGKALYSAEKYLTYQKHLSRLQQIAQKPLKEKGKTKRDFLGEMHQIRDRALSFKKKQKLSKLNLENERLLTKIVEISERKIPVSSTMSSSQVSKKEKSMILFNNPNRKKRQQQILQNNLRLAERLMTKESQFDRNKVNRQVEEYYKLRAILKNNRKKKAMYFGKYSVYEGEGLERTQTEEDGMLQGGRGKGSGDWLGGQIFY